MSKKSAIPALSTCAALIAAAFLSPVCRTSSKDGKIFASGTIEAVEVSVAAKTSGQIEQIAVEEGARVQPGDTLAVIDSASLAIQLRQAEAAVDLAEAQLRLLLKGARIEDIRQVEEAAKQAEATFNLASEDLERIRNLYAKESATLKTLQDSETRFKVAQAQHSAAQQALQKVRKMTRPEEVQAARARLAQAEAGRDLLRKTIADATILSPTSGIVTHKAREPGEFVGPGTTLLTIADLDDVRLNIYVTEVDLGRIRLGQQAEVRIDSHPDRDFKGTVIFISPEAEFTPKNVQTKEERVKLVYRVKIEIPNPESILKPGMPADASI
ncbi:MAG: efflux RND transporter periplasmic adaptor subunit, partial [Candidatus Aminicenantes bacterium]|nr:efflux RND transporter periplasmic adaptor subunit [Candidatus Aminicenantes bacterium]